MPAATRSVITTGPLAAMLMTRNSIPSMPGGPWRRTEAIVPTTASLPVTGTSGMLLPGCRTMRRKKLRTTSMGLPRRSAVLGASASIEKSLT
jgi:hypothetical protein